jgi:hypothetical protein
LKYDKDKLKSIVIEKFSWLLTECWSIINTHIHYVTVNKTQYI